MTNLLDEPKRKPFEGVDVREAGRRGGVQSGISRRLRHQRELEQRIASTKNGAAIAKLLTIQLERDQALDRERLRLDRMVSELDQEADSLRAQVDKERERLGELLVEGDELRQEIAALEQRRQALDSDDAIASLLAEIGEERATAAAIALGWGDDEEDETDVG